MQGFCNGNLCKLMLIDAKKKQSRAQSGEESAIFCASLAKNLFTVEPFTPFTPGNPTIPVSP